MSPEGARLFFGCSICFFLGGAAGIFGLRTLYGDIDHVQPESERPLTCPPPPPCPACPPPVPCTSESDLPLEEVSPGSEAANLDGLEPPPEAQPALPGLPESALPLAQAAVREAVARCSDPLDPPSSGLALIQLSVRATEGRGTIEEALVTRATGGAQDISDCLAEAAAEASFEWSGPDGQVSFKLPLSVGP